MQKKRRGMKRRGNGLSNAASILSAEVKPFMALCQKVVLSEPWLFHQNSHHLGMNGGRNRRGRRKENNPNDPP